MKVIRIAIAVAAVFSLVTLNVGAGLYNVKIALTRYVTGGEALGVVKVGNADFIEQCTSSNTAKLVAIIDDADEGPTAIVTVDPCGDIICTNLVVSQLCESDGGPSNGATFKDTQAERISVASLGDTPFTGAGFLLSKITESPNDSTDITAFTSKGTLTLCDVNGDVLNGTITISGLFKPSSSCPP
jgi:hypothetical protein